MLPEAAWQRCYVHFLRNAMDHLPRRGNDDCLQELRWIYDRREIARPPVDPIPGRIANALGADKGARIKRSGLAVRPALDFAGLNVDGECVARGARGNQLEAKL